MKRAYQIALVCGILPLFIGILIFLLWLVTRQNWLMAVGVFTIWLGVIMVLIGAVALIRFCWLGFRTSELSRRRLWLLTFGCAALLFSNFIVAGGIMTAVVAIETRYTVTIHNASLQSLKDVRITGGGCNIDFGTIKPDSVVERSFRVKHDGELKFHAVNHTTNYNQIISDYISNGLGGNLKVTVNPNNTIFVAQRKN
ncbi:MAG: hypothetical protein K1X66_04410 [Verrucomicrobiae bacterium]|nr:hypothetical protein [Verrucomicrobiae bacterium]